MSPITPSRRTLMRSAVWSTPVVAMAAAAPAIASSGPYTLSVILPTSNPLNIPAAGGDGTFQVRLLDRSNSPVVGATVVFKIQVTSGSWPGLKFTEGVSDGVGYQATGSTDGFGQFGAQFVSPEVGSTDVTATITGTSPDYPSLSTAVTVKQSGGVFTLVTGSYDPSPSGLH